MPPKTASKNTKTKAVPQKKTKSTGVSKLHALEKQLAQRDAEIARLSAENLLLVKDKELRAAELQVINNIGQTLTEGLDLQSTLENVADRLREVLRVKYIGITIADPNTDIVIAQHFYSDHSSFAEDRFSFRKYRLGIRMSLKGKGRSWVVNTNVEKSWHKFAGDFLEDDLVPKAFILLPLLAGKDAIGGITIADFENENAFDNISTNMLETIAANMGTAIQNARLFDETQRLLRETEQRAIELQIINNIGQILTEGSDLNLAIERVAERLRDVLKVQSIAIAAYAPENDVVLAQYIYHKGRRIAPDQDTEEKFKFAIRFAARWAGKSWVANTREKYLEKYIRKFAILGLPKSFAAFPLLSGGEVIGGITIADDESEDAFTDLPISMLETISSNMGTAIQNVRLFDETQRLLKETEQRATELQIINNIGQTLTEGGDLNSTIERVGDRLREALKVENIGFSVWDEKLEHIVAKYYYRNGKPASSETWMAGDVKMALRLAARGGGRSWVVNRNAEKSWRKFGGVNEVDAPKSFVQLPLLAGGKLVGGITIADFEREDAFTNISIGMLETIASNLGTAIQNARLFDETQRLLKETEQRATELQIINNIGQTLTEGLDLNSMIERVAERLHEVLKVDNIGITIINPNTGQIISQNNIFHSSDPSFATNRFSLDKFKSLMRLSARGGNRSWVMNTNAEKSWRKYGGNLLEGDRTPKSFVALPLLVGKNANGGIIFADYEKENAFIDLPIRMLETIAYNMGTGIQNVLLFDETQRLLKQSEQRATELQIVNNIGQTLTEGLDLNTTLERVGERLREALGIKSLAIVAFDPQAGLPISIYMYHYGRRFTPQRFSMSNYRYSMRFAVKVGSKPWVVNTNVERYWKKFGTDILTEWTEIPKTFVVVPLLAGGELVGSISIADYENGNAFDHLPLNLLETIASNMGTAIQNVRLFDETQRLLKETEQRATELQIINNIGQTLTEGGDLESMIQRVGERIQEALNINSVAISIFDKENERVIAPYMVRNGKQIKLTQENYDLRRYKMLIRAWARAGGGNSFWVVNNDIDKFWRRGWSGPVAEDVPKSLVALPLLSGGEIIGGILLIDYEKENAFTDISVNLLETIASNMGTAVQNVRLFEETKRLFAEAEDARAAAEQANKAKSTFLANMSHELRTPLNAIMGFTQIVKGKAEGALPEKQINNLEKVLASSQHLLGLINTVLDIAKIEAGRMDVIPGKFSLGGFADQCLALATPLLKPNVTLEKQVDETIGWVYNDQDKIKQIVLNLLSNAAKFTHKGKIVLKAEKLEGEMISISVKDSGIGINEEALGRVFEEFQQAETTTMRQYGGTGLGLTISRNLARLLGGDLTAASVLGEGSTFTLTFPMKYQKDSASSAAIVEPVHSADTTLTESLNKLEDESETQSRSTILVVEDTELNISFITQLLEDDYNLIFAKNGAQGVTLAQLEKPDLILMDISLPIMDGYEATRRIRGSMADIPIIGLSAYAMVGDAEKAKEAGCNDYVTKPVDGNLLKNKIKSFLR